MSIVKFLQRDCNIKKGKIKQLNNIHINKYLFILKCVVFIFLMKVGY